MTGSVARHWPLDPAVDFLNHGSFGACPTEVLSHQAALRAEMEAEPVDFLQTRLEARLDGALGELAAFLGARADDLVFVGNATTGVNSVLRSLHFDPGDELVVTDHAYDACRAALDWVAARSGARVVVAAIPFPIDDPAQAVAAVTGAVGPRTRLALLDHVTSPTGLVMPINRLVGELAERGVDTLVDGAHAPGMTALGLDELGAAYYAGNCHKWLCAPKGAGFLHVRADRQAGIVPTVISYGANSTRVDRSRYRLMFDWTGTSDPTAFLTVPTAIEVMSRLLPGGWPAVMAANHRVAIEARAVLCEALDAPIASPESMIGSMAAVPLAGAAVVSPTQRPATDPLQRRLYEAHHIQVPVVAWPAGRRLVRISAQLYNDLEQYRRLASALGAELLTPPAASE